MLGLALITGFITVFAVVFAVAAVLDEIQGTPHG